MAVFKDLFVSGDTIKLPIGVEIDGTRFDTVTVGEITGYAEEAMASRANGNNWGKILTALLKAVVVSVEGYKGDLLAFIKALSIGDRDILFLATRYLTYGASINGEGKCEHCGKPVTYVVDLDTIEMENEGLREAKRPFELPSGLKIRSGDKVTVLKKGVLHNPTGEDQEVTFNLLEKNPALWKSAMLQRIVDSIEGQSFTALHAKGLSKKDRDYLLAEGNKYEQAPSSDTLVCPHCGDVTDVAILNPALFR